MKWEKRDARRFFFPIIATLGLRPMCHKKVDPVQSGLVRKYLLVWHSVLSSVAKKKWDEILTQYLNVVKNVSFLQLNWATNYKMLEKVINGFHGAISSIWGNCFLRHGVRTCFNNWQMMARPLISWRWFIQPASMRPSKPLDQLRFLHPIIRLLVG